jgi:hypothetical protein
MFLRANALVALLLVATACSGKKPTEKSGAADKSQASATPADAAAVEPVGPKPIPAPPDARSRDLSTR